MDPIHRDALQFQSSPTTTIGIEIEIQILDRETGDLVPGAVPILNICKSESVDGVSSEFMQSMIEIKTGICANVSELALQIYPLARRIRTIATSLGYDLALAGTHPFARASANAVFPGERYERIRERLGWVAAHDLIFGLHVHVGVPNGDVAIGLVNSLVQYLPHMLALSANSPFWQGVDTGLASFRAAFYGLLPRSGVPPYFGKWKDFRSYMQVMLGSGALQSLKDIYWDIRPRPDYGTIEFRIFDVAPTLSAALSLAALTRSLVIADLAAARRTAAALPRRQAKAVDGARKQVVGDPLRSARHLPANAVGQAALDRSRHRRAHRSTAADRARKRRRPLPQAACAGRKARGRLGSPAPRLSGIRRLADPDAESAAALRRRARCVCMNPARRALSRTAPTPAHTLALPSAQARVAAFAISATSRSELCRTLPLGQPAARNLLPVMSSPGGGGNADLHGTSARTGAALSLRRDDRVGRRSPALPARERMAREGAAARARAAAARGRAALPPHRHHLRGLLRGGRPRAADPLRRRPARARVAPSGTRSRAVSSSACAR